MFGRHPGYGAGEKFLLWRKEERKARGELPLQLKTISQDRNISASSYQGGMDARGGFQELTYP